MSGNIAALAGYTGSGTQGLCVVNMVEGDPEDVVSTVWTKDDNTKQLITGTNIVELESSSGKNTFGGTINFTVPGSDTDIIGGMLLKYDIMLTQAFADQVRAAVDFQDALSRLHAGNYDVALKTAVINKIEILVGSQVWQTINSQDILSVETIFGTGADIVDTLGTPNHPKIRVSLKLPSFTNSINKTNNGYIMSCAPHQDFHVKVYLNKIDSLKQGLFVTIAQLSADEDSSIAQYIEDIDNVKLYLEYTMLSNYERNILSNTTIPKKVFYTQSITHKMSLQETGSPSTMSEEYQSNITSSKITINCDSFSLFCSGLIINLGTLSDNSASFRGVKNSTATLYLNNTRYSAPLTNLENMLFTDLEHFDVEQDNIFINLSNTIMGCGVPFNRYDNIRIEIEMKDLMFKSTNTVSEAPQDVTELLLPGTLTALTTTASRTISQFNKFINSRPITVTAVGYTTVLYQGGSASITTY